MPREGSGGGAWMPGSSPGMTEFYSNQLTLNAEVGNDGG
jgi:hypothetical protein